MTFRHPTPEDGQRLWSLVEEIGVLERNTAYFYTLFSHDFADTCLVAEEAGKIEGFVVGYRPPQRPEALFVWQVGVAPSARGRGLATRMILELARRCAPDVSHIEATVAPDNEASRALFQGLGRHLETECRTRDWMGAHLFPGDHPAEDLFRIGPFRSTTLKTAS